MDYPLMIGGEERGRLRVESAGLYTVMEAELAGVYDGLYRLWVHGEEGCAYLGLMQPWSGGMYLRRRLSRRELESFPANIRYASDRAEQPLSQPEPELSSSLGCPWPAPEPGEGELEWFRRPDGSLVAFDGLSSLVALPAKLRGRAAGAKLKVIGGEEYMVFRY